MTNAIPLRIYNSYVDWFNGYLAGVYARPKDLVWCLEWQEHEEAVQVIEAMWLTWEEMEQTPNGDNKVIWLRDIMYPLMERLTEPNGTFSGCSWVDHKHKPYTFPLNAPPPEDLE